MSPVETAQAILDEVYRRRSDLLNAQLTPNGFGAGLGHSIAAEITCGIAALALLPQLIQEIELQQKLIHELRGDES